MSYQKPFNSSARSTNPFESRVANYNQDDDFQFGNRGTSSIGSSKYGKDDEDLEALQQKIGQVENDSLESTRRALRCLNETEEVGVKTAEVCNFFS